MKFPIKYFKSKYCDDVIIVLVNNNAKLTL